MKNVKKWISRPLYDSVAKIIDFKKDAFIRNMWQLRRIMNDKYYDCKYAIQRAYRGYDDIDIINLNDELAEYLIKVLTEFRKTKQCLIAKMNKDGTVMHEKDCNGPQFSDSAIYMTEEEENEFFDKLIGAIRLMDTEYVSRILDIKYGALPYSNWEKMQERNKRIYQIQNNAKKYVFNTLCLYYNQLWN